MIEIILSDDTGKSIPQQVSAELTVRDLLNAAKLYFYTPDRTDCFLRHERTNKPLNNADSLNQAELKNSDRLMLVKQQPQEKEEKILHRYEKSINPEEIFRQPTIEYILNLTISATAQQFTYPINLTIEYESNPTKYFTKNDSEERHRFRSKLKEQTQKEFDPATIDKILKFWCNEISQGYRETSYRI